MAELVINIAGRNYPIAARDEDVPHLQHLESLLQAHAAAALRAAGGASAERTLVYLALILADMVDSAERNPPAAPEGVVSEALLERIADRLESVAAMLEADSGI